jgi:hypothetical protein
MDGTANGATASHDRKGRFLAGNNEYTAKRRRITAKIRQLAADYDASTPAQKLLLHAAARNLDAAEITRNSTTRERSTNVALRLLSEIPKKKSKPKRARIVTMAEIEAMERSHAKA